jgi:hypothetical protein
MAKISTYPFASPPTLEDYVIGTYEENLFTKNFRIGDIAILIGVDLVPYVGATKDVDLGVHSITASNFIAFGGTSNDFLKADGTLDSTAYTPEARKITINGNQQDLSADRLWDLNTIDSFTTNGTGGAATYSAKVLNIPQYQEQGDYITELTGEVTASGAGVAVATISNDAVLAKVLNGLNISGGSISSADSIIQAFGRIQNQLNSLFGGVTYKGTWNASTNTPTLQSSVGTKGDYYIVSVAGNTNLNGITDWNLGDWAIFDGSVWSKVDNTDAVISVNGYTGIVVLTYSDVGAPPATRTLTINGTAYDLSADRAWTVGDIRSDQVYSDPTWIGSLSWSKIIDTPTTLAGYGITDAVPYVGATQDVDLGSHSLTLDSILFNDAGVAAVPRQLSWNADRYTLDLGMGIGGSVQQIGMETYYTPVKNQTGTLIPDGTFVMATGALGNSGRMTVAPAVTDGSVDSKYMLGVTTHDIANGADGLVTWFGELRGFNTNTKAPVGETWIDGTVLWNNPAVAGGFTSIEPESPNLKIPIAIVISAGNNGIIFVRPRLGMKLTDLHDVDAFSPSNKDIISYDTALGHWNAKSLGDLFGGTSSQLVNGEGLLTDIGFGLSFDGTGKLRLGSTGSDDSYTFLDFSKIGQNVAYNEFYTYAYDTSKYNISQQFYYEKDLPNNYWYVKNEFLTKANSNLAASSYTGSTFYQRTGSTTPTAGGSFSTVRIGVDRWNSSTYGALQIDFNTDLSASPNTTYHGAVMTDSIYNRGMYYGGDYESNFIARSLVTKQYVDGLAVGAGIGLSKLGSNILLGDNATLFYTDTPTVKDFFLYQVGAANLTSLYSGFGVTSPTLGEAGFAATNSSASQGAEIKVEYNSVSPNPLAKIQINSGTGLFNVFTSDQATGYRVRDDIHQRGFVNHGDYEANFTARTLVTKQYVDAAISGSVVAGAGLSIDTLGRIQLGDAYITYAPNNEMNVIFNDPASTIYAASYQGIYTDSSYSGNEIYGLDGGSVMEQYENTNSGGYSFSYNKFGVGTFKVDYKYDYSLGVFTAIVRDSINNKGLEYHGDYELNFTDRSLVTKQYVDGAIAGSVAAGAGLSVDALNRIQFGKPTTEFSYAIKLDLKDYTSVNNLIISTDYESWINGDTVNYANLDFGQISTDLSRQGSDGSYSNISIWNDGSSINFLKLNVFDALDNYVGIDISQKDTNKLLVVDQIDSKGFVNYGDYEENFTARSLVTKQYVDGMALGAGAGLSIDAFNNIRLGDNQTIVFTPSTGSFYNGLFRVNGSFRSEYSVDNDTYGEIRLTPSNNFSVSINNLNRFSSVQSIIGTDSSSSTISAGMNDSVHNATVRSSTFITSPTFGSSRQAGVLMQAQADFSRVQSIYLVADFVNSNGIPVTDSVSYKGMRYAADYSTVGKLDPRWIPDWNSVTTAISDASVGAGLGLSIDGDGNIQLGTEGFSGNRTVNIQSWESIDYSEFLLRNTDSSNNFLISNSPTEKGLYYYSFLAGGNDFVELSLFSGSVYLSRAIMDGATQKTQLLMFDTSLQNYNAIFRDDINEKGLEYSDDYEANFTDRSLVTKQYVDTEISTTTTVTQVTPVTVLASSFTLVGGFYEASIADSAILATSIVEVIPSNASYTIVKDAEFLPETDSSIGSVKVYCVNLPAGDFVVTLNITNP